MKTIKSLLRKPFAFEIYDDGFEIGVFWLTLLYATSPSAFIVYIVLISIFTEEV